MQRNKLNKSLETKKKDTGEKIKEKGERKKNEEKGERTVFIERLYGVLPSAYKVNSQACSGECDPKTLMMGYCCLTRY